MQITKTEKEKSTVELKVEIPWADIQPAIAKAVKKISEQVDIAGFRKGQAPYDVIAKKVGEMTVLQEAASFVVQDTLPKVIKQEALETVGQPSINIDKLAVDNPLVYSAIVPIMPEVTIGDLSKIKAEREKSEVDEEEVNKVIENLRAMRAKEVLVNREAQNGDKLEINFNVFLDSIPVDGGQAEKYPLQLGEGSMIPGFEEQVVGMKAGEEKEFALTFPKDYHNKQLGGKEADFKIKVEAVYERELPELNKALAAEIGDFDSVEALKDSIETNLLEEKKQQIENAFEKAVVEGLVEQTTYGDIPENMLNQETNQMMQELENNLAQQGLKFEDYLVHLKKDRPQLKLDFAPDAMKRIQSALAIRALAKKEDISATEEEVNAEVEKMKEAYAINPQMMEQVSSPAYREYLQTVLRNKKTLQWIKDQVQKQDA